MNNLMKVVYLFLAVILLAACDNDSNKRVKELEQRIAELESNKNTAGPSLAAKTPVVETKPEGPLPTIAFSEEVHDFGTINEGEIVEHRFSFKNTGEAPLIIQNATASCGCTVPEKPKDPIAPGESGEILVKFNSKNKSGQQQPVVTVTANTYPKQTKVKLKGVVNKSAAPADGPVKQ